MPAGGAPADTHESQAFGCVVWKSSSPALSREVVLASFGDDGGKMRWGLGHPAWLEADLEDLAVIAYEPAGMGICESYGPVAAGAWNWNPRGALVGSKGGFS